MKKYRFLLFFPLFCLQAVDLDDEIDFAAWLKNTAQPHSQSDAGADHWLENPPDYALDPLEPIPDQDTWDCSLLDIEALELLSYQSMHNSPPALKRSDSSDSAKKVDHTAKNSSAASSSPKSVIKLRRSARAAGSSKESKVASAAKKSAPPRLRRRTHTKKVLEAELRDGGIYYCTYCDKEFGNRMSYYKHSTGSNDHLTRVSNATGQPAEIDVQLNTVRTKIESLAALPIRVEEKHRLRLALKALDGEIAYSYGEKGVELC